MSSTMCALSSVARLSVSMTMLMSSGAHRRRLYVDGLIGSASSSGVSGSKRAVLTGDDDPASSGPTPPPPLHHKPPHHRHLWKVNPKRAATTTSAACGRGQPQRSGRLPARIESLPNMCNDTVADTPPESTASCRRKIYGNGGRRRPLASSVSGAGVRRHRSHTGAGVSASSDAMTTEESSTSCGDDSSDGQVFDVIREESISR